jgi:hypothetical protein
MPTHNGYHQTQLNHPPALTPERTRPRSCTFVCDPGSCTSYSSTNYVLAGLVLLAHAPASQHDVSTYDQIAALGLRPEDYPHTFTPTQVD